MNIFKKIKDYLKLKTIVVDSEVTHVTKIPTQAIDEREHATKKRARVNFVKQEQQVMANFSIPHEVGCGFPVSKCKQVPCFTHEPDEIVRRVKIKRKKKSIPVDKRFLD